MQTLIYICVEYQTDTLNISQPLQFVELVKTMESIFAEYQSHINKSFKIFMLFNWCKTWITFLRNINIIFSRFSLFFSMRPWPGIFENQRRWKTFIEILRYASCSLNTSCKNRRSSKWCWKVQNSHIWKFQLWNNWSGSIEMLENLYNEVLKHNFLWKLLMQHQLIQAESWCVW